MAKLKALQPAIGSVGSRLARPAGTERDRSRRRDAEAPWRAWYKTGRWQRLRLEVLRRDGWTCQATGVLLTGRHPAPNSPVVDHKRPHHGDPDLFWDGGNLHAVAKSWHDSAKQSAERTGQA